jgi:hypothetical protein
MADYTILPNYESYGDYRDEVVNEINEKVVKLYNNQYGIAGEEKSQYIQFSMERYFDGADLTDGKRIQIHYLKEDGTGDVVAAVNAKYDETTIIFGWLVDANVTDTAGNVQFCVECIGENEKGEPYVWKTQTCTLPIKSGLTTGEGVTQPDENWYTQFVIEMNRKLTAAEAAAEEAAARVNAVADVAKACETATAKANKALQNQEELNAAVTEVRELKKVIDEETAHSLVSPLGLCVVNGMVCQTYNN